MNKYILMDGSVAQPLNDFADYDSAVIYLKKLFADHPNAPVLNDLLLLKVDDASDEIVAEGDDLRSIATNDSALSRLAGD